MTNQSREQMGDEAFVRSVWADAVFHDLAEQGAALGVDELLASRFRQAEVKE